MDRYWSYSSSSASINAGALRRRWVLARTSRERQPGLPDLPFRIVNRFKQRRDRGGIGRIGQTACGMEALVRVRIAQALY